MQRRKGDTTAGSHSGPAGSDSSQRPRSQARRNARSSPSPRTSLVVFLLAAVIVALLTFLFPSKVREVEMSAYQVEQEMEKKVGDFWSHHHQQQQRAPRDQYDRSKHEPVDATTAMERQPSYWVDRERKLKEKLTPLFERQKKGLDLSVPVLTRYLGEDIPIWAGEGVDETEWRNKIEAKYKEDADEEKKWKERMQPHFSPNNPGEVEVQR